MILLKNMSASSRLFPEERWSTDASGAPGGSDLLGTKGHGWVPCGLVPGRQGGRWPSGPKLNSLYDQFHGPDVTNDEVNVSDASPSPDSKRGPP